jgi:hypothetical protein
MLRFTDHSRITLRELRCHCSHSSIDQGIKLLIAFGIIVPCQFYPFPSAPLWGGEGWLVLCTEGIDECPAKLSTLKCLRIVILRHCSFNGETEQSSYDHDVEDTTFLSKSRVLLGSAWSPFITGDYSESSPGRSELSVGYCNSSYHWWNSTSSLPVKVCNLILVWLTTSIDLPTGSRSLIWPLLHSIR